MLNRIALCAALMAVPCHAAPAPADAAAARFDSLKQLIGTWRRADQPTSSLRIRFSLTAGGTVLVESWERGGQPHSLTLYHRDGGTIIATHYCPQGNQPRLALVAGAEPKRLAFAFRDATDLDVATESYLTALSFDMTDDAVLVRRESYRQGEADEPSELRLIREAVQPSP
jgi:hypothetical protein